MNSEFRIQNEEWAKNEVRCRRMRQHGLAFLHLRKPSGRARRGVTLLEIVLAMGLLVMLSTMTYWFYGTALEASQGETVQAQKLQLTRIALHRITTEIRQATTRTADGRVGIKGEAERIWLSTARVPRKDLIKPHSTAGEPPPGEYDLVKVEYKIARHPDILHEDGYPEPLGLARVEILIPRPDSSESGEAKREEGKLNQLAPADGEIPQQPDVFSEGLLADEFSDEEDQGASIRDDIHWEELYAPEIKYLRFCYFDGYRWWDDWDITGGHPLPQLVQVTIGFKPHAPCGEEFGVEEDEYFCECMNNDPVDCLRLPADQMTAIVRVPQADPLFRSRVAKETQTLIKGSRAEEK